MLANVILDHLGDKAVQRASARCRLLQHTRALSVLFDRSFDRLKLSTHALQPVVRLARHIRTVLDERPTHQAPARRFRDELEDHMSPDFADVTLKAVTEWGRYAELFAYDDDEDRFSLDDPT